MSELVRVCKACKEERPIEEFLIAKPSQPKWRNRTCCKCLYERYRDYKKNYHKEHYKKKPKFDWSIATEEEKLERMKKIFNDRVIKKEGCWDFKGNPNQSGYFEIKIGGRCAPETLKAHRVSWMIYNGAIPDGMCVLHKCDNPRCTNPEHLFLGTHSDNVADREQKGRGNQLRGENHNKAVLTEEKVKKIKKLLKLGVMATKIASDFGVSNSTIYHIKYGNTWKNVSGANQRTGEYHGLSVLTAKQVKQIKKLLLLGVTCSRISRDFKVSVTAISSIKRGRTWKYVKI